MSCLWPSAKCYLVGSVLTRRQTFKLTYRLANNIVSFYLGDMLDKAGVTNTTTQLEIVCLNSTEICVARTYQRTEHNFERLVPLSRSPRDLVSGLVGT